MQQASTSAAMNCPACKSESKRFGKHRNGLQRFRCLACRKTFTEAHKVAFRIEDYLNESRGITAVQLLIEGCSIRTAERITGLHRDAILKLLAVAGERCAALQYARIRNVMATDIQADEIWSFIGKKEKNKTKEEENDDSLGDCYTWVAIERKTKVVLAFVVGRRTSENAMELMRKVRRATSAASRFQLTTDGLQAYLAAVDEMLRERCDYGQRVKTHGNYLRPFCRTHCLIARLSQNDYVVLEFSTYRIDDGSAICLSGWCLRRALPQPLPGSRC
jgi:transposase-like protein/IS1 family transposase